jgi:hypothetical protein
MAFIIERKGFTLTRGFYHRVIWASIGLLMMARGLAPLVLIFTMHMHLGTKPPEKEKKERMVEW